MDANFIVHIVDDDPGMRDSVQWLVHGEGYGTQLYSSAIQFLQDYDSLQSGCIVLDIRMPYLTGLELQDLLNEKGSQLPIIFISGYGEINHAVRAIRNGAINFLCKPFTADALLDSIKEAYEKSGLTHASDEKKRFIQNQLSLLSSREKDVLEYVLLGHSNKVIAKKLNLAVKTVEFNRSTLKKKFRIKSISELVKINFALEKL